MATVVVNPHVFECLSSQHVFKNLATP